MAVVGQLRIRKQTVKPWSIVFLGLCLLGVYFLLPQLSEFKKSITILIHANLWLVLIAVILVIIDVVLSVYVQIIAASNQGRFSEVLKRELAGSFLNHFLPYSVGIVTLVEEYYRKITDQRSYAYFVAVMPVLANFAMSIVALAFISPITLSHISTQIGGNIVEWILPALLIIIFCLLVAAVIYQRRIKSMMQMFFKVIRTTHPRTIIFVFTMVMFQIFINAVVLWVLALSVGLSVSIFDSLILILASNFIGNAAPTPGGVAVTEATLTVGLTSVGVVLPGAVAIMLLFRLLTFWVQLIPGGWAIVRLNNA